MSGYSPNKFKKNQKEEVKQKNFNKSPHNTNKKGLFIVSLTFIVIILIFIVLTFIYIEKGKQDFSKETQTEVTETKSSAELEYEKKRDALDKAIKSAKSDSTRNSYKKEDKNSLIENNPIREVKVEPNYNTPTLFFTPPSGFDFKPVEVTLDNSQVKLALGINSVEIDKQFLNQDYYILTQKPSNKNDLIGFYFDGSKIVSEVREGDDFTTWLNKLKLDR